MCDIKLFRNLEVEMNKYVNLESFWLLKNNSFGYQSLASRERLFLDNSLHQFCHDNCYDSSYYNT